MKHLPIIALVLLAPCGTAASQQKAPIVEYFGMCDASAAVSLSAEMFVVASDEDNVLRVYRRGKPDVVQTVPLDSFLKPDPDEPEADIEGAARIDDQIYWITSHGQNKKGKDRSSRHRLFATTVAVQDGKVSLTPSGSPYTDLRSDLIKAPQLAKYKLNDAATLAPEEPNGFNIEGLAATPDGRLLIGFRNPIREGKALVVPINNPKEVVNGKKPEIGMPVDLALKARGIRSMEYSPERERYLVVAGPFNDEGSFALYMWSEQSKEDPKIVKGVDFGQLNPEAIFFDAGDKTRLHILSDDGGRKIKNKDCKKIDSKEQRFRATTLTLD
jgi:hypothetical protein